MGSDGFVRVMTRHTALFYRRGPTLIVGFDNMKSRDQGGPVYPWGYSAIHGAGHSHLGIMMSRRNDWFRHRDLAQFFDDLLHDGFFAQFDRVVFYGASMGGYGALAYSASCPGADVVVFSPQTSLDPARAPFETRFQSGFRRGDWSGAYADGAVSARRAARVTVFADPYYHQDAAHIARLPMHNLVWLRCPNFGHVPARHLKHMGLLGDVTRTAWAGDVSAAQFAQLRRAARGQGQSLARTVLIQAVERGHHSLAARALERLSQTRPDWNFPRLRRQIELVDT